MKIYNLVIPEKRTDKQSGEALDGSRLTLRRASKQVVTGCEPRLIRDQMRKFVGESRIGHRGWKLRDKPR